MIGLKPKDNVVHLKCVCGGKLQLDPELLGHAFRCPHCDRCVRVGLQFLLVDRELAHNITVLCTCGRFIVGDRQAAGKIAKCAACGQQVTLPEPVERQTDQRVVRVSPRALERQLKRMHGRLMRGSGDVGRLRTAGHWGRVNLRPGQEVCVNHNCGAPLPAGAKVCPACGTNVKTGVHYQGPGPDGDPRGKWKRV